MNVAEDGAQWKDALAQAARISTDSAVDTVFINLGANDVCHSFGYDYTGDLQQIAQDIDNTLSYLLSLLPSGAKIYWTGTPNIVDLRNVMAGRRHNYIFRSCQALWDLNPDEITEEAAASLCHAAGLSDTMCKVLADWEKVRDSLIERLLAYYKERYNVNGGPCGRVLNSANTADDLNKAQQFNLALNTLLARKAAQYNGRNGVKIIFTNALYNTPIQPNYVSHLDCYHPNRAGQMKMAEVLWQAFNRTSTGVYALWYDEFENNDWCTQEFGAPWASCWYDYGDAGFDIKVDDQGWLKVEKDKGDQRQHFVERDVGDLSGMSAAWMSFNHKRENLDDGGDRVYFKVYKDGVWHLLDQFQGPGNDLGEHAGNYYDLTPYISSDLRIMFETENQASMKDGDRVLAQELSEAFRHSYNHDRPHEALGQRPPICRYRRSPLGRPPARARVRRRRPGSSRPRQRRDQMERRTRLPQRNPERRAGRAAAGRGGPLGRLVRPDPPCRHRSSRPPHPSPPEPAHARGFDG